MSGPEFASQPGSLAYWRSVRPSVEAMCKALAHGGLRSWDAGTCGAHVSIGLQSFGTRGDRQSRTEHLRRVADSVYTNPRFSTRLSGRVHDQPRWCGLTGNLSTLPGATWRT